MSSRRRTWIDPGLARAAAGRFRELDPRERGPLFEGWIATVLAACRDYRGAFDEVYDWAPAGARATEVDRPTASGRGRLNGSIDRRRGVWTPGGEEAMGTCKTSGEEAHNHG